MVNLAIFERMPRPGRPASRWGYLGNAFVLAGHRSQGIGTALLHALMAHAQDRGCVRVVLSPTDRSVPFYHRAEFGPATMLLARTLGDLQLARDRPARTIIAVDDAIAELLKPLTYSRRAHSVGVGERMESVANLLPTALRSDAVTAAYLHDVGYGHPDLGFHPIDGARLLRSCGYSEIVCHVVAFHTAAEVEAEVRGLGAAVFEEFRMSDVAGLDIVDDFMWWADLCTGPNGEDCTVDERLNEILRRYKPGSIVHTAITQAEPRLRLAVQRVSGSM